MLSGFQRRMLLVIFILGSLVSASAQQLASRVEGTVRDQSGGVIPGVTVTLTNQETNVSRTAITNDSGVYVFPQVFQGLFRVSAEMTGFKTAVVEGVRVEVSLPAEVNLTMEIGGVDEQVIVTASEGQSVLNTVNAEINTIVNREQIDVLPLNGRDVSQLALMQAGVTGGGEIAREASVNGLRGTFNNLTLDGVNNQDNFIRTDAFFGVIPLRESFVEEFNLTTQNTDVDAGMGVSQTLMVTRSGTNAYHGQVFYYHRNDALNANTFFNNAAGLPKERVRNHMYGGNLGGPILRDRLFFFANYEQERDPGTLSVSRNVLTDAARQGIFTYRQPGGQLGTVNLFDITGTTPDPEIGALLGQTPLPNEPVLPGANIGSYRFNSPVAPEQDWVSVRVDFEPTSSHSVTGTFHQFRYELPNDAFNDLDARFPGLAGAGQESTRRLGSVSWRSNLTTTLSNEARFGVQWAPVDFTTQETFDQGYQILFSNPGLGESDLFENPVQNFMPQGRNAPVYDLMDTASWITGNHTFRFGGGYRAIRVDQFNAGGTVPQYILGFGPGNPDPLTPGLFPGQIVPADLELASEMLGILGGYVRQANQTFNVTSRTSGFVPGAIEDRLLKQNFFHIFGSDTWRLTPDLTMSLGLRWEYHGVPTEADGLALLPVGGSNAVLDPMATIDFAGEGTGRDFFNRDWNNFAPNVGFAWRPFGDRTVFRAGYGINYVIDNNMTTVNNALRGNPGLSQDVFLSGIEGTLSGTGRVPIEQPEFMVPRTARDQILSDPTAALFTIDPDLRVPYVQQWNVGIQREISQDMAVEVRYVGNRGLKLTRAIDLNQVMLPSEFVEDFQRAQRNLAASGDPTIGEELTIFPQLGLGGFLQSGAVQSWIRNGEIGQYVGGFLAPNRDFFFAGEGGEELGAVLPIGYFLPNPNAFVADVVANNSFSNYNALQVELRRRYRNGFTGQFNYTFGKALTNFSGTQSNFRGYFDNAQQHLEVLRPDYDITHTLNGNFVWQLPVGAGRAWTTGGVVDALIGGWDLSGIARVRSGEVINIVSERGTINRGGSRATTNTVHLSGLTIQDLQDRTGTYRADDGRILLFDPSLVNPAGGANPEFFQNPGLLEAGTLGLSPISGPWYATLDAGIRKNFNLGIREDAFVQVRFDVFNIFNRTNFNVRTQPIGARGNDALGVFNRHNINSASFGVIDDTFSARQMQVGLKVLF